MSSRAADFRVVNAPTTSMFYDNLVNGVSYTFTVKAINIVGGSVSSAPSNSVIPGGVSRPPCDGTPA